MRCGDAEKRTSKDDKIRHPSWMEGDQSSPTWTLRGAWTAVGGDGRSEATSGQT